MKRMLINATQEEELRMAMVDGQLLYDLNIEAPASERKKANIYKGKITRIEPSLEAAFVDYGADRHGFLPMKEISSEYYVREAKSGGKPNIKDVLREGQDIVIQVEKEERGNKGAALTTFVSLAGRFIVLKPNKDRSGGVSRRITGEDRDLARQALKDIEIPDSMSVILRTAGIDRSTEELKWDIDNLLTVWSAILNIVLERESPFLIYRESDSVVRALRDYLTSDIGEILIDDEDTYKTAYEHVEQTMPQNLKKLKHYVDPVPLFTRYQIETQIESAFAHNVTLPSGGSIVIDHTEAMVSIDINSARATKGGDIEATAFNTNLEAADEIARQLRIRDLGGLIVIDFIDMGPQKHQREVENRLRDAVRQDRARVQIGKISRFGLLEMSRQRLRPSIDESAYKTCPRCTGFGTIRGTESLALAILRIIGEEARKERTAKVIAQLPVEVATYLLNEKRDWVQGLEDQTKTQVVLIANPALETPHYDVRRVRDDQLELAENTGVSYRLVETAPEPESPQDILKRKGAEPAAVGTIKPSTPAPVRAQPKTGLWKSIVGLFTSDGEKDERTSKSRGGRSKKRSAQQTRSRTNSSRKSTEDRKTPRKRTRKAPQKKTKNVAPKDAKATQQPKAQEVETTDENKVEKKRTRNRRSRGGRRRRNSADKPQTNENQANSEEAKTVDGANPSNADAKPESGTNDKAPNRSRRRPAVNKDNQGTTQDTSKALDSNATNGATERTKVAPTSEPTGTPARAQKTTATKPEATTTTATPKPKNDGPPRARTDAERHRDAEHKVAPPKSDSRSRNHSDKDAATPVAKPAPKTVDPVKTESTPRPVENTSEQKTRKPVEKPAARAASKPSELPAVNEAPKPDTKPIEKPAAKPTPPPAQTDGAGGGRLLPWENDQ